MSRSSFRTSAFVAVIGFSAFLVGPNSAHSQSADLVLCDRVAADPADPDKPRDVNGVTEIASSDRPAASN